jgi:ABC-2 type transport system ATP-binding protein
VIRTRGLTKRYGARVVLDDVDLEVPEGTVYGLVGPNGAGKTTLLSILAGIRRADSGALDLDVDRRRIAVLPDAPRYDKWLTGREVVSLAAALVDRSVSADRVEEVLGEAGVADAADRRVAGYSRGMLQRLGVAATVVGGPRLLLLDEPASALDPAGRREVLDLVGRLRGTATVVFSSHILDDVQQVCDRLGVLDEGRLVFQGPTEDLLQRHARPGWRVRVRGDAPGVASALEREAWVRAAHAEGDRLLTVEVDDAALAERSLAAALDRAGARLVSLEPLAPTLEQVFLELTT